MFIKKIKTSKIYNWKEYERIESIDIKIYLFGFLIYQYEHKYIKE